MRKGVRIGVGFLILGLYAFLTFVKCGAEGGQTEETLIRYEPGAVDSVAELYQLPLGTETIADMFGVEPDGRIGKADMEAFLRDQVGLIPMDAAQASRGFGLMTSASFVPNPAKRIDLIAEGIRQATIDEGLTPAQYLAYLRVAHGGGRCEGVAAGTPDCPAAVRDFQLHLIVLQNPIFNIRSDASEDDQYRNKFSIHREAYANRLTFDFIGYALGLAHDPLRDVVLDERCDLLESMFATGDNLHDFLVEEVGVVTEIAQVVANQYVGTEEMYDGDMYEYGLEAFFQGDVCCRYPDKRGTCYEEDMAIYGRLLELHPDFSPSKSVSCAESRDMINVMMSMPATISEPQGLFSPPFDQQSPKLTASELVDFVIAIGNALTNMPNAPFADIVPEGDLELLSECGVYNSENELTSRSIAYFYERFLRDVRL